MMPGVQFQEVHKALLEAYNKASLRQMLRFRLDRDLEELVADATFSSMIFDLLALAEEEGWDTKLVREAHLQNPGNAALAAVYEKYGWAPEIILADESQSLPPALTKASAGGLEKIIRPGNPSLDMAVWRTRLSEVEVRICRVDLNNGAQGTGLLVGPEVILTNFHVVKNVVEGKIPMTALSCLFDSKSWRMAKFRRVRGCR